MVTAGLFIYNVEILIARPFLLKKALLHKCWYVVGLLLSFCWSQDIF